MVDAFGKFMLVVGGFGVVVVFAMGLFVTGAWANRKAREIDNG